MSTENKSLLLLIFAVILITLSVSALYYKSVALQDINLITIEEDADEEETSAEELLDEAYQTDE